MRARRLVIAGLCWALLGALPTLATGARSLTAPTLTAPPCHPATAAPRGRKSHRRSHHRLDRRRHRAVHHHSTRVPAKSSPCAPPCQKAAACPLPCRPPPPCPAGALCPVSACPPPCACPA